MLGVGRAGPLAHLVEPLAGVEPAMDDSPGAAHAAGARHPGVARMGGAMPESEQEAIAVLLSVDHLGPVTLATLVGAFGSALEVVDTALERQGARRLREGWLAARSDPASFDDALARSIVGAAQGMEAVLRPIRAAGLRLVAVDEPDYPPRLRAIELPPPLLFVRGSVESLAPARAFAVVGTRRPTDAGRMVASGIAAAIAKTGGAVISGLAAGIDGSAHAAAVREGGTTVAVLGGGHDRLFPRLHERLAAEIVDGGGAVISEHPPLRRPERWTFPRRNRIIAGLAEATIVVEAGINSGALITAAWALEQGRGCFLVPGPLGAPASEGCLAFLRECHGEARIVAGIPSLLEDLGLVAARPVTAPTRRRDPGERARAVLPSAESVLVGIGAAAAAVGRVVAAARGTVDEIVAETDLPIATVLASLTILEDRGLVVSAYGRYRAAGALAATAPGRPGGRAASRRGRPG